MSVIFVLLLLFGAIMFGLVAFGVASSRINLLALGLLAWICVPLIGAIQAL